MHFYPLNVNTVFEPFKKEIEVIVGEEVTITYKENYPPNGTVAMECFTATFQVESVSKFVSFFSISGLPGCCGVCVSHGVHVAIRNKGIGSILNRFRKALAKDAQFGLMICTDWATNVPQNKIMQKNGWLRAVEFVNPKTKNKLNLHYVDLNS